MIEENVWYWEYIIKVIGDDDEETTRAGIVTGETFSDAVKLIEDFYGTEIIEIKSLKAITDIVFDFNLANDDPSFDFSILKK